MTPEEVLLFGKNDRCDIENTAPYKGKIIVEIDLLPETSAGGILVPYSARIQICSHKIATVLKVHPDFTEAHGVDVGDKVLLENFINETWLDDKPWRICVIREEDVACRIVNN